MTEPLRPAPDEVDFEQSVEDALASLPSELREFMSNVAIVIEDEPPAGMPLLGLYEGFPLDRRSSAYAGVAPDKITIYQRPLLPPRADVDYQSPARDPGGAPGRSPR